MRRANLRSYATNYEFTQYRNHLDRVLAQEKEKEEQLAFLRRVADQENEFLSRTVYVTRVRDLTDSMEPSSTERVLRDELWPRRSLLCSSRGREQEEMEHTEYNQVLSPR